MVLAELLSAKHCPEKQANTLIALAMPALPWQQNNVWH
jgi:hypothetical protein